MVISLARALISSGELMAWNLAVRDFLFIRSAFASCLVSAVKGLIAVLRICRYLQEKRVLDSVHYHRLALKPARLSARSLRKKSVAVWLGAFLAIWAVAGMKSAFASDGDLDFSFGYQGASYLYWANYYYDAQQHVIDSGVAVIAQPDGRSIAISQILYSDSSEHVAIGVARLTEDGHYDPSFGDGTAPGEIVLFDFNGDNWSPNSAALDPDGNIVIVGVDENAAGEYATVWKLTSAGLVDRTFAAGAGMVRLDRGVAGPADAANALVIGDGSNEPRGSIFIAGKVRDGVDANGSDGAIFFLAADGAPLTTNSAIANQTLANGGRYWQGSSSCPTDPANPGYSELHALSFNARYFAGLSTHYLIAGGSCSSGSVTDEAFVLALGSMSNLDANFGGGGISYFSYGTNFDATPSDVSSLAISYDTDGNEKITVVGSAGGAVAGSEQDFGIARLLSDGSYDTSLASSGHLTINVGACCNVTNEVAEPSSVLIQRDGKTLIAGTLFSTESKALLRLNLDGTGDTTFGGTGALAGGRTYRLPVTLGPIGSGVDLGTSMAFAEGEKILLAGPSVSDDGSSEYFGVVRVQNDLIFVGGFDPLAGTF